MDFVVLNEPRAMFYVAAVPTNTKPRPMRRLPVNQIDGGKT